MSSDPKLPPNTNYCKCSGCGLYFGGASGFDMHRRGIQERVCIDPSLIADKAGKPLLRLNDRGYWVGTYG